MHVPHGVFNMWLLSRNSLGYIVAGVVFALGFAVWYEMNEDFHLRDGAYIDVQGWLFGIFFGALWFYYGWG